MKFEKVSFEQWREDFRKIPDYVFQEVDDIDEYIDWMYKEIKLPKQGTARSMGMDFFAPYPFSIEPHHNALIPTGIRWITNPIDNHVGLIIVPRSGLGFKYGLKLVNTVGVIDADYHNAKNEGHIMIKLHNPSEEKIEIKWHEGFAQGIITPFFICDGAESDENRTGGFGSTG